MHWFTIQSLAPFQIAYTYNKRAMNALRANVCLLSSHEQSFNLDIWTWAQNYHFVPSFLGSEFKWKMKRYFPFISPSMIKWTKFLLEVTILMFQRKPFVPYWYRKFTHISLRYENFDFPSICRVHFVTAPRCHINNKVYCAIESGYKNIGYDIW